MSEDTIKSVNQGSENKYETFTRGDLEKKYGRNNVHYFLAGDTYHEFFLKGDRNLTAIHEVSINDNLRNTVIPFTNKNNGILYTGVHTETDWVTTRWWIRGIHLVNRTGDFAVVIPPAYPKLRKSTVRAAKSAGRKRTQASVGIGGTR